MRTAVSQTSLIAYDGNQRSGKTQRQHERVLRMLKRFPNGMTNSELAQALKLPASTIAARINWLKSEAGGKRVGVLGRRICRITGFTAQVHAVNES